MPPTKEGRPAAAGRLGRPAGRRSRLSGCLHDRSVRRSLSSRPTAGAHALFFAACVLARAAQRADEARRGRPARQLVSARPWHGGGLPEPGGALMASGSVKKRLDSGRRPARLRDQYGKPMFKDCDAKIRAERWIRDTLRELELGHTSDLPRPGLVLMPSAKWPSGPRRSRPHARAKEPGRESEGRGREAVYAGLLRPALAVLRRSPMGGRAGKPGQLPGRQGLAGRVGSEREPQVRPRAGARRPPCGSRMSVSTCWRRGCNPRRAKPATSARGLVPGCPGVFLRCCTPGSSSGNASRSAACR